MDISRLVKMANDIGDFFAIDKDRERGAAGVADHIRMFWEPRMRRQLLVHFDETGGEGLDPIVLEALRKHGHELDVQTKTPRST
jgi:formate dehydrogenase subunit delta